MAEILVFDKSVALLPVGGLVSPSTGTASVDVIELQSINVPVEAISYTASSGGAVQNSTNISVLSPQIVMGSSNPYIPPSGSSSINVVELQSINVPVEAISYTASSGGGAVQNKNVLQVAGVIGGTSSTSTPTSTTSQEYWY